MKKCATQLLKSIFLLAFIFASSCTTNDPSHLIFYEDLNFGFNAKGSVDQGTLDASFGYDRDTTTIIPKSRTVNASGTGCINPQNKNESGETQTTATKTVFEPQLTSNEVNGEADSNTDKPKEKVVCPQAMSVISKSLFDINWLGGTSIKLHFATGQAAINLAKAPQGVQKMGDNDSKKKDVDNSGKGAKENASQDPKKPNN